MPTPFRVVVNGDPLDPSDLNQFGGPINALETAPPAHTHTIGQLSDWPAGLTVTELGYLGDVTSAVQAQLNGKASTSHTHTISQLSDWPAGLSVTELGYLSDVTSAVQAQLNGKASTSHTHNASDITGGTLALARGGTGLGSLGTAGQALLVNAGATALEYGTPAAAYLAASYCHAHTNTQQTLTAATWVDINWHSEYADTDSYHSTATNTNRFVAPSSGLYEVVFSLCLSVNSANTTIKFAICIDGAKTYYHTNFFSSSASFYGQVLHAYVYLTAGQYASLQANASNQSVLYDSVSGAEFVCRASIRKVAA